MSLPDCGHILTPRAESIETLAHWICRIDRGKWSSDSHYRPTPTVRQQLAAELNRQLAGVPEGHCMSCGAPMEAHVKRRVPVLMGCGR